jgi:hypothetical protein
VLEKYGKWYKVRYIDAYNRKMVKLVIS